MHCSLPDPSARGILQERIMEWTAIPFSMIFPTQGSNLDIPWILQADSFLSEPPGKLICFYLFFFWGGRILPFPQSYMGILCIIWGLISYWFYALKGLPPRRWLIILCLYRVRLFCFCMVTHFICKLSHLLAWDNSKHFLFCVSNTFICLNLFYNFSARGLVCLNNSSDSRLTPSKAI